MAPVKAAHADAALANSRRVAKAQSSAGGFSRGSSSFIVATKGLYDPEQARSVELGDHPEAARRFELL